MFAARGEDLLDLVHIGQAVVHHIQIVNRGDAFPAGQVPALPLHFVVDPLHVRVAQVTD